MTTMQPWEKASHRFRAYWSLISLTYFLLISRKIYWLKSFWHPYKLVLFFDSVRRRELLVFFYSIFKTLMSTNICNFNTASEKCTIFQLKKDALKWAQISVKYFRKQTVLSDGEAGGGELRGPPPQLLQRSDSCSSTSWNHPQRFSKQQRPIHNKQPQRYLI